MTEPTVIDISHVSRISWLDDKSPANSHHASVVNNIIELAEQAPLFHASLARVTAVPSPIHRRLSFQKVSELHKLYGVFQI